MRTANLARRYLPLAVALGALLLIIALFPSTASTAATSTAASAPVQGYSLGAGAATGGSGGTGADGSTGATGGGTGDAGTGATAATGSGATGATAGGGSTAGGTTGGSNAAAATATGTKAGGAAASGGQAAGAASGDTTHCVGGREYDPKIDYYAPPCTPGTPGSADPANGGATSQGVTANQIEVVYIQTNYGAVVNSILQAEGAYVSVPQAQQLTQAWANFVNSKYVLWGRKIHVDVYASQCTAAPPDLQCLLPEMDKITATYHPYAVEWVTTVCSACFAELAKDGVVAVGGAGFTDSFSNQLAPYFYQAGESATRMATQFAEFWCKDLSSVSVPSRKVAFAGTENNLQNFNGQPRVLGVVTENDPQNEDVVSQVLQPALNKDCGDGNSINQHHYYYNEDASTAAQQTQAGISAMNTPQNPATSVLCLCDVVAPAFSYGASKQENYWPEAIIADTQGMDADTVGQSYESGTACSSPPCEFDNAFGLASADTQLPAPVDPGLAAYQAGGGSGTPVSAAAADASWENFNMLASLIENTGPALTPARMAAAAPSMGMRGGGTSGHYEVGFAPGDYQWTQDSRIVYWSKTKTSTYNNQPGTYVTVGGTRYLPGQFPTSSTNPAIPAAR